MNESNDTEHRIDELEERIRELEKLMNREHGYNIGTRPLEPQKCDCVCGETFEVNVTNGLICPECGRGSDERKATSDTATDQEVAQ